MAEPENTSSTPKTSSVPLKKETVRITLRARPGAGVTQPRESTAPVAPSSGNVPTMTTQSIMPPTAKRATAPISLPSAPLPPPAPKAPTSPVTLPPAAAAPPPAPTAPRAAAPPPAPRAAGAPPPAPTMVMRSAAPPAPKTETGAMTAPLQKAPSVPRAAAPAAPGSGTGPLAGTKGATTGALPKATVKLQQTQPMARAPIASPPSAPVKRAAAADSQQFYEDDKDPEAGLGGLSIACVLVAAVLMGLQMLGSDKVYPAAPGDESSPILVPSDTRVTWEKFDPITKQWQSSFKDVLPDVPN